MEKIKIENGGYSSKEMKLTEIEILIVVKHWHDRMMPDIFQNENGQDLSDECENQIDYIYNN